MSTKEIKIEAKDLVSEFIGTYLLVLTVGCNVLGGSGTWAALSIASVLMVSVYALGSVSGAAFNPAVTLAVWIGQDPKNPCMNASKFAAYVVTQLTAGILAGLSYLWLHGSAFNLEPGTNFTGMQAGAVEILYTFMLCFVVLRTAISPSVSKKGAEYYGLAIGFVIVAGGYAGGWISKGAFNPAVAVGVDVASASDGVYWCFLYTVFELIGAALAAAVHLQIEGKTDTVAVFISEFLGTFFLVLTVGLNVLGQSPAPALSIAASLMCMIYALGDVSGAHFNPAVTVSLLLVGEKVEKPYIYFAAQLAGGLIAGLVYSSLTGSSVPLGPGAGHGWSAAGFAEIIYTFVLCFTVLNTATVSPGKGDVTFAEGNKSQNIYGLAIGFCVVVGGYAIGSVSGGSLNPAVSFGLDASHAMKGGSFMNCLAYTVFELAGAGIAAGAYTVCRGAKAKEGRLPINGKNYGAI